MNPDPRVRRGAHRTSRAATATLLPSLLAILAVTSLITALYVWRGEEAKPPSAAASSGTPTPQADPTTTPPAATTTAATEPVKTTTSAPATPTKTKTKTKKDTAAELRASVAIVVLNQTSRSGLAATVATRLREKGWTVSSVGNFRGVVPATTVYYPVGMEAAANAAAKNLPTPPRVLPRFGNLSESRLTVVVTTNYPS